jgi:translation initiation factor 3 subunit M
MSSVIVVDTELKDSIAEYGQIIDSINQNDSFSTEVKQFLSADSANITNKPQLITKLYELSDSAVLIRLPDKDFEPAFNLLIHILLQLADFKTVLEDSNSPVYELLLKCNPTKQPSLTDRRSLKSTTILSIFNTIFNLLPETSSTRIFILTKILYIIKSSNYDFKLIEDNLGNNLIAWLNSANVQPQEMKSIFWQFIQLMTKINQKSLNYIDSFTKQFDLDLTDLHNLIKFALSSEVVDVSFLINNNVATAIKNNSSDKLVALFYKYVKGELVVVNDEIDSVQKEFIESKSKILNMAKFFSDNSSKLAFEFTEIPAFKSNPEQFELLLIDAIKTGVLEGKVNQLEQKFYLTRVNRFVLAGEDNSQSWEAIKPVLLAWKQSLTNINEVVRASRDNIVESAEQGEIDEDA